MNPDVAIRLAWLVVGGIVFGLITFFAAIDVGRKVRVSTGWFSALLPLAGLGLLWTSQIWFGGPPIRWGNEAALLASAAGVVAIAAGVGAVALAASRSLRPRGHVLASPSRWHRWRLGFALLAAAALPIELAFDRHSEGWAALPITWICVPMALAFARTGEERLDRGAAAALGLTWVAAGAGIGALAMFSLAEVLGAMSYGGRIPPSPLEGVALRVGWVTAATTLAVWRWPDPRGLIVVLPVAAVHLAFGLHVARAPNPASEVGPDAVPEVVNLLGQRVRSRLAAGLPPPCLQPLEGALEGLCPLHTAAPWLLAPDLPLAQAPVGSWVVWQQISPTALGYGTLDVSGAGKPPTQTVRIREEGGWVVVDGESEWPMALGLSLHRALGRLRPPGRWRSVLRVEIEQSARWTVQDAVSICASASSNRDVGRVQCALVP